MATKNERSLDFKSPPARISYADNLFKPRAQNANDPQSKRKYGCTLIFPKTALTEKTIAYGGQKVSLQDIINELITAQWGANAAEMAKNGLIRNPFLAGDGKSARNQQTGELHPGMGPDVFFIRTQANAFDAQGQPLRGPIVSSSATAVIPATAQEVYSGCYGFAALNAFCWDHPQNGKGVSFGISAFYKRADGERIGGGRPDAEAFLDEKVEDQGPAPEATQGGAGAGGLFG